MSISFDRTENIINQGDTAELVAFTYDLDGLPSDPDTIDSVVYDFVYPDGSVDSFGGTVEDDGSGFYRYETSSASDLGIYKWKATFTFLSGERRSYTDSFIVVDPFDIQPPTWQEEIARAVWLRLEDCFDSENGGPWLRDKSLAYFESEKFVNFVSEGLLIINTAPPHTNLDLSYFTTPIPNTDPNAPDGSFSTDPDQIVLVQAVLVAVIKHLMRSYVEQPDQVGANVVWHNRRDYLQRWQSIYQIELDAFNRLVALWKRSFINLGHGALLTSSKAGRLYPAGFRTRNAMRGYYSISPIGITILWWLAHNLFT